MPEKPNKLMPALYGGLIIGVISGVPGLSLVNCCCCAGVLFGGMMAVFFYQKDLMPDMGPLTSADTLQLGALAGVFGALVGTVFHVVVMLAFGDVSNAMLMEFMSNFRDKMPPGTWEEMEGKLAANTLTAAALFIQLISSLVLDAVFGLLGGLIGYAIWKPKPQVINMNPPPPPMPQ